MIANFFVNNNYYYSGLYIFNVLQSLYYYILLYFYDLTLIELYFINLFCSFFSLFFCLILTFLYLYYDKKQIIFNYGNIYYILYRNHINNESNIIRVTPHDEEINNITHNNQLNIVTINNNNNNHTVTPHNEEINPNDITNNNNNIFRVIPYNENINNINYSVRLCDEKYNETIFIKNNIMYLYIYYDFIISLEIIKHNIINCIMLIIPIPSLISFGFIDSDINFINLIFSLKLIFLLIVQYLFFKNKSKINKNNIVKISLLVIINCIGVMLLSVMSNIIFGFIGLTLVLILLLIGSFTTNIFESGTLVNPVGIYLIFYLLHFLFLLLLMPIFYLINSNNEYSIMKYSTYYIFTTIYLIFYYSIEYFLYKNINTVQNYTIYSTFINQFAIFTIIVISLIVGTLKFNYILLISIFLIISSAISINYIINQN